MATSKERLDLKIDVLNKRDQRALALSDLTPEEFLQRLESSKSVPTFTPPVAEVYQAVFGSYLGTGDEVVFITPSSKMSASYQNA